MENKKGVELALNTVIVALILIIVLVVVVFVFSKFIGQESDIINESIANVGKCVPGSEAYTNGECDLVEGIGDSSDSESPVPSKDPVIK